MTDKELRKQAEALLNDQNYRDLRELISFAEGTNGRYDQLFGFDKQGNPRYFTDFSKFPDSPAEYRRADGSIGVSNDAGKYQINIKTYQRMAKRLGITDFSKESQDLIATALILENKNAREALSRGDMGGAVSALRGVWFGLANRPPETLQNYYNSILQNRGAKPSILSVTPTAGSNNVGTTQSIQTNGSPNMPAYSRSQDQFSYFSQPNKSRFFDSAMNLIANETWNEVPVPGVYPVVNDRQGNKTVFSGNIDPRATDAEGNNILLSRLFNTNPNVSYGLAYAGNGLYPTRTDDKGTQVLDDRLYSSGTPVEPLTPVYDATKQQPAQSVNTTDGVQLYAVPHEAELPPDVNMLEQVSGSTLASNTPLTEQVSVDPNTNIVPQEVLADLILDKNMASLRTAAGLREDDALDQLVTAKDAARMLLKSNGDQDLGRTALS